MVLQPEQRRPTSAIITGSALHKIPFDVWSIIGSFSTRSDLARFSVTSSYFLSVVRPLFYQVLVLKPRVCAPTWTLLARDEELASSVSELTLDACKHRIFGSDDRPSLAGPQLFIDLDALANLTSLKRITLIGTVFKTAEEQSNFGHIVSVKSRKTLKTFTFEISPASDSPESWPGVDFGTLADLRTIEWFARTRGNSLPYDALTSDSTLQ